MEKKPLTSVVAASILLLFIVIYTLIINIGKLQANTSLSWISYCLIVGGIIVFVIKYGKDNNDNVTFGNLFGYGFKTAATLALFFIIFIIIFYLIFPEYKDQLLEISRQKALENAKGANTEQVEKGMEMFKKFFWVGIIAGVLISYAILGLIGSLIGAAIAKKNPNSFNSDINQIGG